MYQNYSEFYSSCTVDDYKTAVAAGYIDDCPVTVEDIKIAEDIFGPDIHRLKGATTRKRPYRVTEDYIEIPPELFEVHKNVTVGIDFFYVNGELFFVTVSRNIKFCTVENVNSTNIELCVECLKSVRKSYNKRGFIID